MTLKRNTLLIIFLMFCFSFVQAQWVSQWHGFIASRGVNQIQALSADVVWATVYDGGNLTLPVNEFTRTLDGGQNWIPGSVNGASGLQSGSIFALNADTAWIMMQNPADTGGYIFRTNDGGLTWIKQDSARFHAKPEYVHFWNDTVGVSVGDPYNGQFEIFTTINGGLDWQKVAATQMPVSLAGEYTLPASFCVQGDSIWFGGNTYGKIFVSHDRGNHWSFIPSPLNAMKKVIFYDTISGLVGSVSVDGQSWDFYITHDRGLHWTAISTNGTVNTADIDQVPGTPRTFVSVGFRMSFSSDNAVSWIPFGQPSPVTSPYFNCVSFIDPSNGWAGGINSFSPSAGGIYRYAGPALEIPSVNLPDTRFDVYPNPASNQVNFSTKGLDHRLAEIHLYNMMGQVVRTSSFIPEDMGSRQIDIQGLPSGIYLLRLVQHDIVLQKELIVR